MRHNQLLRFISSGLICLFTPGGSYVLGGQFKRALGLIFALALALVLFAYSRWITSLNGFYTLNIGLLLIHFATCVHGLISNRASIFNSTLKQASALLIWFVLCWALIVVCHNYKSTLLGFNLYHIPSRSMAPALNVGDIVLTDTWPDLKNDITGEIIVFKRHEKGITLIKRVQLTRALNNKTSEVFVVGDNVHNSVDSRRFGWVASKNIIGIATATVFSIK